MRVFPTDFAHAYNARWGGFAEWIAPRIKVFYETLPRALEDRSMLDICCGTGQLSGFFLRHGYDVTGLDLSAAMLGHARENAEQYGGRARFFTGDAADYSLDHRVGLAVASGEAVNHLPSREDFVKCLNCTFSALSDGGLFAFDIRTSKGFYHWNDTTFEESDDGLVVRGGSYDGGGSAWQRVVGFDRISPETYRRFEQMVDNTVYPVEWVESRLLEVGWRQVRTVSLENLNDPLPVPEDHDRVMILAQR